MVIPVIPTRSTSSSKSIGSTFSSVMATSISSGVRAAKVVRLRWANQRVFSSLREWRRRDSSEAGSISLIFKFLSFLCTGILNHAINPTGISSLFIFQVNLLRGQPPPGRQRTMVEHQIKATLPGWQEIQLYPHMPTSSRERLKEFHEFRKNMCQKLEIFSAISEFSSGRERTGGATQNGVPENRKVP